MNVLDQIREWIQHELVTNLEEIYYTDTPIHDQYERTTEMQMVYHIIPCVLTLLIESSNFGYKRMRHTIMCKFSVSKNYIPLYYLLTNTRPNIKVLTNFEEICDVENNFLWLKKIMLEVRLNSVQGFKVSCC